MKKLAALMAIMFLIACQTGRAEENHAAKPCELTSRGVISGAANEAYNEAIESCSGGKPGNAPEGPQFLACLKRQLRSENENLAGTYNATASILKSSADKTARLRNAQNAWMKFRDENCAFARAVAPRSNADEFFYDCLLRSTIDRRVELRSLVGD